MGDGAGRAGDGDSGEAAALGGFLALVELGVIRPTRDRGGVEVRRPDSPLWENADDVAGLARSASVAMSRGWVVVSQRRDAAGAWALTGQGQESLRMLRWAGSAPHERAPVVPATLAGSLTGSLVETDEMGGPLRRTGLSDADGVGGGRLVFTPVAVGPSWMIDVTELTAQQFDERLSMAQRIELRSLLDTIRARLSRTM